MGEGTVVKVESQCDLVTGVDVGDGMGRFRVCVELILVDHELYRR